MGHFDFHETIDARGGSYTLRLHRWSSSARYPAVTGNRVVAGEWDYGPVLVDSCSTVEVWRDNRLATIDAAYRVTPGALLTTCPESTLVGSLP